MATADENRSAQSPSEKLKLSDKIWIAVVIAAFVIGFVLIVIYDFI